MKKVKTIILIMSFCISTMVSANPLEIFEVALRMQNKVEQLDHDETLNTLENINESLSAINDRLPSPNESTEALDLFPGECEDVGIEELICQQQDDQYDVVECYPDSILNYTSSR